MKFSFILLAHNEELTIKEEIENLYNKIIKNFSDEYEVIICEDGSADNTQKIIQEINKDYSFMHLTSSNRKGVSKAMLDAFSIAKGNYIFFTDAGKKFDFNNFWHLYEHIHNYDLVSGLRTNRKDQKYRIIENGKIKNSETLVTIILIAVVLQRGMNILGVSLPDKM